MNILYVIPSFIVLFVVTFACMTHLMHYGVFIQDLANVNEHCSSYGILYDRYFL